MTPGTTASPRLRLAALVAEIFAPAVLVTASTFAVGFAASRDVWSGLLWSLISAVFCGLLPLWFMVRGAALGRWDTHHVRDREDRLVPLLVAVGSVATGLVVLHFGSGPRELVALVLSMLCCLLLATGVTQVWKISLHAAISAGTSAIMVVTFGPWFWLGAGAVALVGWSRCATGDHTLPQVAVGGGLGWLLGGGLYVLFLHTVATPPL